MYNPNFAGQNAATELSRLGRNYRVQIPSSVDTAEANDTGIQDEVVSKTDFLLAVILNNMIMTTWSLKSNIKHACSTVTN